MFGSVNSEDHNDASGTRNIFQDELHQMLEEATRRREEDLRRTGRKATIIIGVPLGLLVLWAVIFLVRYQANQGAEEEKPVVATHPVEPVVKPTGEYDAFLPEAMRGDKPAKAAPGNGMIMGKEDISFAMDIYNFGNTATEPKKSDGQPSGSAVHEH